MRPTLSPLESKPDRPARARRRSSPSMPTRPRRTIPWWQRGRPTYFTGPADRPRNLSLGGPFFMPSAPSVVLDERAARSPHKNAMLARSLRLSPVSVSCRRWMEVSYSIVETRCAYRVTHLDGYNLPLTSFHHLAWAVGQLISKLAAHQLPELPKPKLT